MAEDLELTTIDPLIPFIGPEEVYEYKDHQLETRSLIKALSEASPDASIVAVLDDEGSRRLTVVNTVAILEDGTPILYLRPSIQGEYFN